MAWRSPRLRHRVWMRCYAVAVLTDVGPEIINLL